MWEALLRGQSWLPNVYNVGQILHTHVWRVKCTCTTNQKIAVFAPETTDGWKAGSSVANCLQCNQSLLTNRKHDETHPPKNPRRHGENHIRGSILEEVTSDNNELHTKVSNEPFEISDDNDDDGTGEDEFDCSLKEPVIKSSTQALQIAKQLTEFVEYSGLEELSSALLNVNDILRDLRLREPRKQTFIDSFFN